MFAYQLLFARVSPRSLFKETTGSGSPPREGTFPPSLALSFFLSLSLFRAFYNKWPFYREFRVRIAGESRSSRVRARIRELRARVREQFYLPLSRRPTKDQELSRRELLSHRSLLHASVDVYLEATYRLFYCVLLI